jgi:hypothetical protein
MDCTLAEPLYIHKQEKLILLSIKMLRINHGSKRRSDYPNHPAACKMAACYLEITTMSQHLLIIDPQNDFCDHPTAALPVTGACRDMERLAKLIEQHGPALDAITVTLDSHHRYDIAHPAFWYGPAGEQPLLCPITLADVDAGRWLPADPALLPAVRHYLQHCALFVWPPHCLVGSWGHNIHDGLNQAYSNGNASACARCSTCSRA